MFAFLYYSGLLFLYIGWILPATEKIRRRAMIEYVRTFAQARGCTRLYWVTHQENQQAQKLYEKIATRMDMIQYRINL